MMNYYPAYPLPPRSPALGASPWSSPSYGGRGFRGAAHYVGAWYNWLPEIAYRQGQHFGMIRPEPAAESAPLDWGGIALVAGIVGLGLVGYLVYRQVGVAQASIRGGRRGLLRERSQSAPSYTPSRAPRYLDEGMEIVR